MDGSGAGALAAVAAVVGLGARVIYRADRYERAKVRQRQQERGVRAVPQPTPPYASPAGWPEDLRAQLARCAYVAADRGFVTAAMLQRRAGIDPRDAARMLWALEYAGIIGVRYGANGQARTLLRPDELPAALARFGIAEDAIPPGAQSY